MAQTKYNHKTVQSGRHIARDAVSLAYSLVNSLALTADESLALRDAFNDNTQQAKAALRGECGLNRETQVERLEAARVAVGDALKTRTKIAALIDSSSTKEQAILEDTLVALSTAKMHLTSVRQFAKDRRFESKQAQYAAENPTDAAENSADFEYSDYAD